MQCNEPNTNAKCVLDSDCTGDGLCLRVCGCSDCVAETRPPGPFRGQMFYDLNGREMIYDGQEWLSTGKTNWRDVDEMPVGRSQLRVRNTTTVVQGVERTGLLQQGFRHDFSIEARNLNENGYASRSVLRSVRPSFLPATPVNVFALSPKATSCFVLWAMGPDSPQAGPTTFFRIQITQPKRNIVYFDPKIIDAVETSAVIKDLWPGTTYSFKVFAGNLAGLDPIGGGNGSAVTLTTLPFPSGIGVSRIDTSDSCGVQCNGCPVKPGCSITMYWDAVPNQEELEYKVTMRLYNAFGDPWVVKASEVRGNMAVITDLREADTLYDVCVYGRVIGGEYHPTCTFATGVSINSAPSHAVSNFRVDNMTATELRISWRALDQYDPITFRDTEYLLERSDDNFAPDGKGLKDTVELRRLHHPSPDIVWFVIENDKVVPMIRNDVNPPHPPQKCYYDTRFLCLYATLSGLTPGQAIHLRVRARNANVAGFSSISSSLIAAPFPRTPPAHFLRVTNVTDTSVLLEWERPEGSIGESLVVSQITWEPDGRLQVDGTPIKIGYNEQLKTKDGGCSQGRCWFNATGLTKTVVYTFRIRLDNNHETGFEPGLEIRAGPVGTPDPPSLLFVASVTTASIHVRWRPPHGVRYTGQPAVREPIKYRLQCRLMQGYLEHASASVCHNDTTFLDSGVEVQASDVLSSGLPMLDHPYAATIHGLQPGVGYRLQVCSGGLNVGYGSHYFAAGCGAFVEIVTAAPPAPVTLTSPGVEDTAVLLSWTSATAPSPFADMGWNFIEGMDLQGYTLTCPGGSVSSLKAACQARQDCAGFNTFGCLKSHVPHFWPSIEDGRELDAWLTVEEISRRIAANVTVASAAASAQQASNAAGAMPASDSASTDAASKQAAAVAAALDALEAEQAAQYLTATPVQHSARGEWCCPEDPTFNEVGVMTSAGWTAMPGCTRANADLHPYRAACGCECVGLWYKTISYRVQMQPNANSPFTNVKGADRLISQTFTVRGLTTGQIHGFRIFAHGINGNGPDNQGSNVVFARPLEVPPLPTIVSLVSTYRPGEAATVGSATLTWSDVDAQGDLRLITHYKVQVSLDGILFVNSLSYENQGVVFTVGLPEVPASAADVTPGGRNTVEETISGGFRVTTFTVMVDNLQMGTKYWLRVVARNANVAAYSLAPSSNVLNLVMSGAPPPVINLRATLVQSCMQLSCGCECCGDGGSNTCEGLADVTIQWNHPEEAFTISKFRISAVLAGAVAFETETPPTSTDDAAWTYTLGNDGEKIPGALTEEYVIKGLMLHRAYSIQVTGRNANTEGYKFPATFDLVPSDLPSVSVEETLKATGVTASEIALEWRPVLSQPVSFYKVDFDTDPTFPTLGPDSFFGEFSHEPSTDPDHRMRITLTGLTQGLAYYVLVTPRNINPGSASTQGGAFMQGYRPCPVNVDDLVVVSIPQPSAFASFQAFRLTWTAPSSTTPIFQYRIWHAPTIYSGQGEGNGGVEFQGKRGTYRRLADYDAPAASSMTQDVDGFSKADSPHHFLVTPIARHCALLGPVVPRPVQALPEMVETIRVSATSVTVRWRSPGCQDACLTVSHFLLQVTPCNITALVHAHALGLSDCDADTKAAVHESIPVLPIQCMLDGWCEHEVTGLAPRVPVKLTLQAWLEGHLRPDENVSLIVVPVARAEKPPTNLVLLSRNNAVGDPAGASVLLAWSPPTLTRSDEPVDRFKIGCVAMKEMRACVYI